MERPDRLLVALAAVVARGGVVAWAAREALPAADGLYYHRLAVRLAEGAGYTWLWPDGVVTHAAHYPVGYPFLLSLAYRVLGPFAAAGALLNLLLGVAGVVAVHELTRRFAGRRAGLVAGLLAALDPATVLYTPALMTEGVTASLLAIAAALVGVASAGPRRAGDEEGPRAGDKEGGGHGEGGAGDKEGGDQGEGGGTFGGARGGVWWLAAGLVLGLSVLIRPQCLLIAPLLGFLAPLGAASGGVERRESRGAPASLWLGELRGRLARGALLTGVALLVCLPWTARNCVRMDRCALVSVNGGWNLLIGAGPEATGHWAPVDVPPACREVFAEAAKDVCFGQAAREIIRQEPGRWLGLVPAKLAATFDYCGAGPWYLHEAAPGLFPYERKVKAGALETVVRRLMLIAALLGLARGQGRVGWGLGGLGVLLALTRGGWLAYVVLTALAGLRWGRERRFFPAAALVAALGTTILVHAIFFGAGRYGLVVSPLIAVCAGALLTKTAPRRDTAAHAPD